MKYSPRIISNSHRMMVLKHNNSSKPKSDNFMDTMTKSFAENFQTTKKLIKGTIMEQMAKRMPADDAKSLASYWGYSTASSSMENAKLPTEVNSVVTTTPQTVPSTTNAAAQNQKLLDIMEKYNTQGNNVTDATLFHPVMGELLMDLGYKKLYLTSISSLSAAPVWHKQRILRPDRSALIAKDKIRTGRGSSICGAITMYVNKDNHDQYGIVDGQHRAGALLILSQKGILYMLLHGLKLVYQPVYSFVLLL